MSTATRPPETGSSTVTSWVPLTTAFSAPNECSTQVYSIASSGDGVLFGGRAFDPSFNAMFGGTATCLPPAVTDWWQQTTNLNYPSTLTSFGPLVCPQHYYTATSQVLTEGATTLVACCPSNYSIFRIETGWTTATPPPPSPAPTGVFQECFSLLTQGKVITYFEEDNPRPTTQVTSTIPNVGAFVYAVPINGYIFGPKGVLPNMSTSSSMPSPSLSSPTTGNSSSSAVLPSATSAAHSSPATTTVPIAASSQLNQTTSPGLTPGATIGIGVGVALGIMGLCAIISAYFVVRRMMKRQLASKIEHRSKQDDGETSQYTPSANLSGAPCPPVTPFASSKLSTATSEPQELQTCSEPSELYDQRSDPFELEGFSNNR